MSADTAAELTAMMKQVVKRGHRHRGGAPGRRGRRQDRHRRDQHRAGINDLWFIGFTRQGRGRRRARARRRAQGGIVAAPIAKQVLEALGRVTMHEHRARHPRSTAATGWSSGIGSGGMADVWCAEDQQLGRRVALKLLYRRFAEDQEFVERFRREASRRRGPAAPERRRRLRPRRVGRHATTSRWSCSRALAQGDRPRARRRSTAGAAVDIIDADPARGALRAPARDRPPRHQAAQRDRRRGGPREGHRLRDRPRRRVGHDRDRPDHGHRAVPLARAGRRATPVDARSDLYSIGIVLYELLTGRVPFEGESRGLDRAQAGLRATPSRRGQLNPAVPPALEAVVLRALEKDPARPLPGRRRVHRGAASRRAAAIRRARSRSSRRPAQEERRARWWLWSLAARSWSPRSPSARTSCSPASRSSVPDVVGQRRQRRGGDAAEPRASRSHSAPCSPTTCPRDRVIAQDPAAGERAEEGTTVTLTVSERAGRGAGPARRGPDARRRGEPRCARRGFKADAARGVLRHGAEGPRDRVLAARGRSARARAARSRSTVSQRPQGSPCPSVVGPAARRGRAAARRAPGCRPT